METRGLTLRSKSRRARPQISAPKPISGPLPPNQKPADPAKAQQNDATSDLVKRRYSTRFNQAPDFDAKAPPVPTLPQVPGSHGGIEPPGGPRPSPDPSQRPKVDLNVLRDPSLPVDRCEFGRYASAGSPVLTRDTQMWPTSLQMPRKTRSTSIKPVYEKSRTERPPTSSRMSTRTAPSSSRLARKQRNSRAKCGPCAV